MAQSLHGPFEILHELLLTDTCLLCIRAAVNTVTIPNIIQRPEVLMNSFLSIHQLFWGKYPDKFPVIVKCINISIIINRQVRGNAIFLKFIRCRNN